MDLKTPPAVRDAVMEAAKCGMYGYTRVDERTVASYLNWQKRRKVVDKLAATIILQGYLDSNPVL